MEIQRKNGAAAGAGPSNKRKGGPDDARNSGKQQQGKHGGLAGPAAKRARVNAARKIRSQPSDAAYKDGELDLQSFVNAREFEIRALEAGMRSTKAASATRAFQEVPRSMRRRTASHNAKRVPKRLRNKARREMELDNTPTVESRRRRPRTTRAKIRAETARRLGVLAAKKRKKMLKEAQKSEEGISKTVVDMVATAPTVHTRPARPKIRRNALNEPDPAKPNSKFKKRQINKTWLPTHLWHAKRARMTEPTKPLWRFAVPLTPSEKVYRPTHRALGQKGVVVWDTSYTSTIGLYGSNEGIERVFKALGLNQESLWGKRGLKWRTGTRKWTGMLSKQREYGRRDIGPADVIWNPEKPVENTGEIDAASAKISQRQVLIRTHPSCFLELFNELLKLVKMQTPRLYIEDLRYEIGSIDLTGPGSTETLLGILQPYHDKSGSEEPHSVLFKALLGVTNPTSLPKDAILAFSIADPRLRYPFRPNTLVKRSSGSSLMETLATWPAEEELQPTELFDRDARHRASQLPAQSSLNRRKSARPGQILELTSSDPPIPIVLMASRAVSNDRAQGSWTLLAPWGCIRSIWYGLVHYPLSTGGNPRFGGLEEIRQAAFERGEPWFPGDFLGTDSGIAWELEQREKRRKEWDRRPKGKRVEWSSLDLGAGRKGEVGDGFACDFEMLFGLPVQAAADSESATTKESTEHPDDMDIDSAEQPNGEKTQSKPPRTVSQPLTMLNQMTKAAFLSLRGNSNAENLPDRSLVTVNVEFIARGVASRCARIYRLPSKNITEILPSTTPAEVPATGSLASNGGKLLPSDLRDQWLRKLPSKPKAGASRQRRNDTQTKPPRQPANPGILDRLLADMGPEKQRLAEEILNVSQELEYPAPPPNVSDINGHPLCPNEEDLIGFLTTGAFSLAEGKGTAIGAISADKALETLRSCGSEGNLCIVRNAGENVGWLARWEVI